MVKRICVFCGASPGARESYTVAAKAMGRSLAANGIGVVFGGGNVGLMGALAAAAMDAGGEVIGIIPRALQEKELANQRVTELRVVSSMHERKAMMAELSEAFIAMPGGYGTFEEFCEVLTWTQLGFQRKPCGLLNIEGYYDHLLGMFDHAVAERFLKQEHREMIVADTDAESLVNRLLTYHLPFVEKWIDRADAT